MRRLGLGCWVLFTFACGDVITTRPESDNVALTARDKADGGSSSRDAGSPVVTYEEPVDAGQEVFDAGLPATQAGDAGVADAGQPPPPDAGLPTSQISSNTGWTIYGAADGLPSSVLAVSVDEGGNLWVAGGEEGLFVRRAGATTFERFTLAEGLHPYGYMPDGSDAPGPHYLKVLSVAGGPAGTVFVGYAGQPPAPGELDCESNWDGPNPNPAIYKSGDADKVTLTDTGISVVHYDIFSGPASAPPEEPRGREKLCHVFRIAWDKAADRIWFGANHGFAMGLASYTGNNTCNGNQSCSGLMEHVHPAINGWIDEGRSKEVYLTADYRGVAVDPVSHDVFFGGAIRSTLFTFGTHSSNLTRPERGYWDGQADTEGKAAYQWDLWKDAVAYDPTPSQRVDDHVFGASIARDGSFWVSSGVRGVAHVAQDGTVLATLSKELISPQSSGIAVDPSDGSVWVGARWSGGVSRIYPDHVVRYGAAAFGLGLASMPVSDVYVQGSGAARTVMVAFEGQGSYRGGLAVYSGQ